MISILACPILEWECDNTVDEVACVERGTGPSDVTYRQFTYKELVNTKGTVVDRDNFILRSAAIYMPYLYSLGSIPWSIRFGQWAGGANPVLPIQGLPQTYEFYQENVEVDIDAEVRNVQGADFVICAAEAQATVNQINGPAILQSTTQYPVIFIKIEHTIELANVLTP